MPIWPLVIIIAAALVIGTAIALVTTYMSGTRHATRVVRCPVLHRTVVVEFVESIRDGRALDVVRCSAFVPPTAVDCDKRCVLRARQARGRPVPALLV